MKGDQYCPICRAKIADVPIWDNVFGLELYDAIADGEVSRQSVRTAGEVPYTWPDVIFGNRVGYGL
jgi:hypothetical protein